MFFFSALCLQTTIQLSMYLFSVKRGWRECVIVLWCLLDSTPVTADSSNCLASSQRVCLVSPRGGSSAFPTRTPPTVQGRPGKSSFLNQPKASDPFGAEQENEDIIEDDAATREMINSFLTRESRNSFIGRWEGKMFWYNYQ